MKSFRIKYLLSGMALSLLGIFLIYRNSLGKYFDPLVSHDSRYRGHLSEWFVIAGIGIILIGVLILIIAFSKQSVSGTGKEKKENTSTQ